MPRRGLRRLVAEPPLLPSSSPEEPVDEEWPLPRRRLSLLSIEGRFNEEEADDEALFLLSIDRARLDAIGNTCGDGSLPLLRAFSLPSTRRPTFSPLLLLLPPRLLRSPSMPPMLVLRPCGVGTCTQAFNPQSMCTSQQNENRPEAAPSKSTTYEEGKKNEV